MFKLLTKRALIALTFVVCVGSGFNLDAKKHVYSTHTKGLLTFYKQTNYMHCRHGCEQAPNVIKHCTSRCRACLGPFKDSNPDGIEFVWGTVGKRHTGENKGEAICGANVITALKMRKHL